VGFSKGSSACGDDCVAPNNCACFLGVFSFSFRSTVASSMTFSINLTRRVRRRKLKDGSVVEQTRYVLNWRDPRTGEREQRFFERQREAQERRTELIAAYDRGAYSSARKTVTVADAVAAWLETKRGVVRPITFATYAFQSRYVVGPLAPSEARRAIIASGKGAAAKAKPIELLGREKVQELTTRRIRAWHKLLSDEVSIYCANKAMQILKAALALAAEDHEFRPPAMPTGLQRQRDKARKAVLTPQEVARLLAAAHGDLDKGVYVAFPFLAGTRPSEQLGLLWDDVDFEADVIRVQRIQLRDGSLSEFTKTAAGVRSIPMSPLLREMLLTWRVRCPRKDGKLERVFPAPGVARAWPLPRVGGGGPLIYGNFRKRFWATTLHRLGLPAVTPHSARHSFISTLQAQGIEVGLVAKLAGHKNAVVTLSHYTHAMRGGEDAVKALDRAYAATTL
jgi:integrase